MKNIIILILVTTSLLSLSSCGVTVNNDNLSEQVLLYNVTFDTPPHVLNSEPMVSAHGQPRACPSKVVFGHPIVIDSIGLFSGNSCVFTSDEIDGYTQLQFITGINYPAEFTEEYDKYHIEMDILIKDLVNDFTILLDRPTVQTINFYIDNQRNLIDIFTPFIGNFTIGEFEFDVPIHLEIDLNVLEEKITISIDDEEVYNGSSEECEMLRSVRINLCTGSDLSDFVALDNVLISGSNFL